MKPAPVPFSYAPGKGRVYDLPCPVCRRALHPIAMADDGLPQLHFHLRGDHHRACRLIVFPPAGPNGLPYVHEIPLAIEARDYIRRFVRE